MMRDGREIDIRCEMKEYLSLMSKYFSRVIIHRRSFFVFFLISYFFIYIYEATPNNSNNRTQSFPTWYARVCVFYSNLRRSRSDTKCMKASETREERENASAISIVWFYSCVTECSGRDEEIIYISWAICMNVFYLCTKNRIIYWYQKDFVPWLL